jgi:hypothetical protein
VFSVARWAEASEIHTELFYLPSGGPSASTSLWPRKHSGAATTWSLAQCFFLAVALDNIFHQLPAEALGPSIEQRSTGFQAVTTVPFVLWHRCSLIHLRRLRRVAVSSWLRNGGNVAHLPRWTTQREKYSGNQARNVDAVVATDGAEEPVVTATRLLATWRRKIMIAAAPAAAGIYAAMAYLSDAMFATFSITPAQAGIDKTEILTVAIPVTLVLAATGVTAVILCAPIAALFLDFVLQTIGVTIRQSQPRTSMRIRLAAIGGLSTLAVRCMEGTSAWTTDRSTTIWLVAFFAALFCLIGASARALALAMVCGTAMVAVTAFTIAEHRFETDAEYTFATGVIRPSIFDAAAGFRPIYVVASWKGDAVPAWFTPLNGRVLIDLGSANGVHELFNCFDHRTYRVADSEAEIIAEANPDGAQTAVLASDCLSSPAVSRG